MICFIAENFEAGNSLNPIATTIVGQHADIIDFAMLSAQIFSWETDSLLDVM